MSEVQRRVMDLAARDAFVRFLGAECVDAGSGTAVVRMTVGALCTAIPSNAMGSALAASKRSITTPSTSPA